jgi:hypothetical protein
MGRWFTVVDQRPTAPVPSGSWKLTKPMRSPLTQSAAAQLSKVGLSENASCAAPAPIRKTSVVPLSMGAPNHGALATWLRVTGTEKAALKLWKAGGAPV